MHQSEERLASVAAAFRTGAKTYESIGSPLYSELCLVGAESPEVIALAARAMIGAQPVFHLLTVIHALLLASPDHPLSRFYATLAEEPLPPADAGPDFLAFCHANAKEIVATLQRSTVQTTFVERCVTLLPPIIWVADQLGEPLHLIEIGCSAGVLLAMDKYAYCLKDRPAFGSPAASLRITGEIVGDPPLRIPSIASRTGLDLNPLDVRSPADRRWLNAQVFPEYRHQREQLNAAFDVVAATDIRMVKGDALATLPGVLADTGDPLCLFHSVCLSYWTDEALQALDEMLMAASLSRTLYRVGSEPSRAFSAWNKGHDRTGQAKPQSSGEVEIVRYENGRMDGRVVATNGTHQPVEWLGWRN